MRTSQIKRIEKVISRAVTKAKQKGFKIVNKKWGIDFCYEDDEGNPLEKYVPEGKCICPMSAVVLMENNKEGCSSEESEAAADVLKTDTDFIDGFVMGVDSKGTVDEAIAEEDNDSPVYKQGVQTGVKFRRILTKKEKKNKE